MPPRQFARRLVDRLVHTRPEPAWTDGIHADFLGTQLHRALEVKVVQSALAHAVGTSPGITRTGRDRADIYYAASSGGFHQRGNRLDAEERPLDIDRHDSV